MKILIISTLLAVISALPSHDPIIRKLDSKDLRYDYMETADGTLHLFDTWMKLSDLAERARYDPDSTNEYHLFTRDNPTESQPLVKNYEDILSNSNFDPNRRIIVTIHGFLGHGVDSFNSAIIPAYLEGEDVNVIVLDWSAGSHWGPNVVQAALAGARFFNWLNQVSGANSSQYHIIGFSVGGHAAGVLAKDMDGDVAYVTGLDPSNRFEDEYIITPDDGSYVEIIHTAAGFAGWSEPLGHVDFYPNGGVHMPGCFLNPLCDHDRSFHYMAESVMTGGFTGWECPTHWDAYLGDCRIPNTLQMGGRAPKTGSTGIFWMRTNRDSPFSMS